MRQLLFIFLLAITSPVLAQSPVLQVYKSPSCGCCGKWVDHIRNQGFDVDVRERRNLQPVKIRAGIQPGLGSCHTAFIDGYTIEGHVPAADVKRLLNEQPEATGLAVPGMPMGSPGMEGPRSQPYEVLLFGADGTEVFSHY